MLFVSEGKGQEGNIRAGKKKRSQSQVRIQATRECGLHRKLAAFLNVSVRALGVCVLQRGLPYT